VSDDDSYFVKVSRASVAKTRAKKRAAKKINERSLDNVKSLERIIQKPVIEIGYWANADWRWNEAKIRGVHNDMQLGDILTAISSVSSGTAPGTAYRLMEGKTEIFCISNFQPLRARMVGT
jgi:hypothetical protein